MDAKTKRDMKTRRRMLGLIEAAKAGGWSRGRWIAEIVGVEDEELALGLLADLANLGMIEGRDTRTLKAQEPGLAFSEYRVTARGTRLLAGLEPVEPLFEDERI